MKEKQTSLYLKHRILPLLGIAAVGLNLVACGTAPAETNLDKLNNIYNDYHRVGITVDQRNKLQGSYKNALLPALVEKCEQINDQCNTYRVISGVRFIIFSESGVVDYSPFVFRGLSGNDPAGCLPREDQFTAAFVNFFNTDIFKVKGNTMDLVKILCVSKNQ